MQVKTWKVDASVGNANGVFDAAYSFGWGVDDEGGMSGTPEEIAAELVRFLRELSAADCQQMKYGTGEFFVELRIRPQGLEGLRLPQAKREG